MSDNNVTLYQDEVVPIDHLCKNEKEYVNRQVKLVDLRARAIQANLLVNWGLQYFARQIRPSPLEIAECQVNMDPQSDQPQPQFTPSNERYFSDVQSHHSGDSDSHMPALLTPV